MGEHYLRNSRSKGNMFKILILIFSLTFIQNVVGHGRLRYPPSRASMWRDGFPTPPDYNDNQGFCGGATHQQSLGGKCGICGDHGMVQNHMKFLEDTPMELSWT